MLNAVHEHVVSCVTFRHLGLSEAAGLYGGVVCIHVINY